jgi:hypothetical protein
MNISRSSEAAHCSRRASWCSAIVALFLTLTGASTAASIVPIQYLQIPGPYGGLLTSGTFTLPGYGQVNVSWAGPSSAQFGVFAQDLPSTYNQQTAGGSDTYTWLTDSQDIGIQNNIPQSALYTLRYTFLSGQPDLNKLLLTVIALAKYTKVTLSNSSTLVGEFQLPLIPVSAPTVLDSTGTVVSGNYGGSVNQSNTGWALFKFPTATVLPTSGGNPYLELSVAQIAGDGIGTTLAYTRETIVPKEGIVKVCKIAGDGVSVGTPFSFAVTPNGTQLAVPAGPGPGGYCVVGPSLPLGTSATITETVPAGDTVTSISVVPTGGTTNLASGTATIPVGNGVTEVTYTNERHTGYLEICKSGKVKGDFGFMISPGNIGPITVPAGACSPAIQVAAGQVTVQEVSGGGQMIGCTAIPASPPCVFGLQSATVNVAAGDVSTQTILTVINGGRVIEGSPPARKRKN